MGVGGETGTGRRSAILIAAIDAAHPCLYIAVERLYILYDLNRIAM